MTIKSINPLNQDSQRITIYHVPYEIVVVKGETSFQRTKIYRRPIHSKSHKPTKTTLSLQMSSKDHVDISF